MLNKGDISFCSGTHDGDNPKLIFNGKPINDTMCDEIVLSDYENYTLTKDVEMWNEWEERYETNKCKITMSGKDMVKALENWSKTKSEKKKDDIDKWLL